MHRRPFLFRCHQCGRFTRIIEAGQARESAWIKPARYSCGHQDKLADLTTEMLAAVSPATNYTAAATADPQQFHDDFRRGLRILAGIPPAD
jgi:hypothetical protein